MEQIKERYFELKKRMEDAYNKYNIYADKQSNDAYKMALTDFQDFCVEQTAKLVGDYEFVAGMEANK